MKQKYRKGKPLRQPEKEKQALKSVAEVDRSNTGVTDGRY